MADLTSYIPEMIATRRELHKIPEIAWTEFLTSEIVINRVRELGFKTIIGKALFNEEYAYGRVQEDIDAAQKRALSMGMSADLLQEMQGYTGCMAIWKTGKPGPVTAFRFDMDCVAVDEPHDESNEAFVGGFDSKFPGLMHACGHDAHTAMGLSFARWIHDHADELCGTIKLVFQPAEEGTKGAAGIAESGLLDDVDYFIGGHIGMAPHLHELGIITTGFLSTTKINVKYTGKPAHAGAAAEQGRNALMAACSASMQIMGIARHGQGNTGVNIGTLHAGEGRNVVPAQASMELEVRGANDQINNYMQETALRMIKGSAESYGVECQIKIMGHATNVKSDDEMCALVRDVAEKVPGIDRVFDYAGITSSEDCSLLIQKVQSHGGKAAFFYYGCNHHGHHQSDFEIQDTESMPLGFAVFVGCLQKLNGLKA